MERKKLTRETLSDETIQMLNELIVDSGDQLAFKDSIINVLVELLDKIHFMDAGIPDKMPDYILHIKSLNDLHTQLLTDLSKTK